MPSLKRLQIHVHEYVNGIVRPSSDALISFLEASNEQTASAHRPFLSGGCELLMNGFLLPLHCITLTARWCDQTHA